MRRIILSLLICCQIAQAETVSIATWNLEWFPGGKPTSTMAERAVHMSAAKEGVQVIAPDVFCAQEIRDWDSFLELVSVAPKLKPHIVSHFRDSPTGGPISIQQTAIASVFEADSAWYEAFKPAADTPPRGFSFASVQIGGSRLLVYSVHLKSNLGGIEKSSLKREESVHQLIEHVVRMEKLYAAESRVAVVIAGDFNTDPTDSRFAAEKTFTKLRDAGFSWCWEDVALADRVTCPSQGRYPDACFDGFLVKGAKIVSCKIVNVENASDHNPVLMQIDLGK